MTATLLDPAMPANTAPAGYWRGLADVPWNWGRSVVTLGVFDGLHRGHVRLLGHAVELGRRRGLPVVVATGDIAAAAQVLGRPHQVRGYARGGHVQIAEGTLLPPPGRYRVRVGDLAAVGEVTGREVLVPTPDGPVAVDLLDAT